MSKFKKHPKPMRDGWYYQNGQKVAQSMFSDAQHKQKGSSCAHRMWTLAKKRSSSGVQAQMCQWLQASKLLCKESPSIAARFPRTEIKSSGNHWEGRPSVHFPHGISL